MSIKSAADFEKLRAIGSIVANTLKHLAAHTRAGVTTAELDQIGERFLSARGAQSAPPRIYKFPGAVCISVNDEAIHGIPGERVIGEGDLVKLDLVAEKDGYYADAAVTVQVGKSSDNTGAELIRCAESAFRASLRRAQPGNRVYDIGRAVDHEVRRRGFSVIKELCGHGVGRSIHEEPSVPNYYERRARQRLTEGLVLTIEPIISAGSPRPVLSNDGWTIRTADGSLSAHYEHTIVITRGEPVLLTAA
jgi:methionyl aminopeptidase